ncbi:uncharacterized protein IL334_002236 [Kwoniella shivajii]|uniref:Uncharacterized protein n=1 Tax=Kwoniella shivajii TaxID=564305 RepID=A0ABZ1CUS8_9TREE|nr:hypothetical protein IL334_002236 [Kwoniella shivajii]
MILWSLQIKHAKSDGILIFNKSNVVASEIELERVASSGDIHHYSKTAVRRLTSFRHVRKIVIHSLPSDSVSDTFAAFVQNLPFRAFPSLESVVILAQAVDDVRTWVPATYDRPRNPPLLEALTLSSSPAKLCVSFRSLRAEDWEEHRDLTVPGQYQLVRRLNRLREDDHWSDIREFCVHNVVHQVLPSLPNCRNSYQFASHITGNSSHPVLHHPGPNATYLPGPLWSYRAWQLGTAIKISFHPGLMPLRDDDDESGVGYDEVLDLVKGAVKAGLPQDLPMREGFGKELVGEVFEKVQYKKDDDCMACQRNIRSVPLISNIRDLP